MDFEPTITRAKLADFESSKEYAKFLNKKNSKNSLNKRNKDYFEEEEGGAS